MKINDFKLECYFGKYEFTAPYLLTRSDCESMTAEQLLDMEPGAKDAYLGQWLGYTETWGDPELRELIAGLYSNKCGEYSCFSRCAGGYLRVYECYARARRPYDFDVS